MVMQVSRFNGAPAGWRVSSLAALLLGLALCSTAAWAQDDDMDGTPPAPRIQMPNPPPAIVTPAPAIGSTQLDGVPQPPDPSRPQLAPIGPVGSWPATPGGLGSTQPELGAAAMPTVPSCLRTNPFGSDITTITSIVVDAGYTNVRGLYEACDNLWRGHAMMNGMDVSIMVTPTGSVIRSGY
jgi:hypothetical protein